MSWSTYWCVPHPATRPRLTVEAGETFDSGCHSRVEGARALLPA